MARGDKAQSGQITGLLSPFLESVRLRKIASYVGRGMEILDVGCGRSKVLDYIQEPKRYLGVEILAEAIDEGKFSPHQRVISVNIERDRLPEAELPFDVIILGAVVEHFIDPEETLLKLRGYLRKGGRIVLTTPCPRGAIVLKVGAMLRVLSREAEAEHNKLFDRFDIERLSKSSGFKLYLYERFLLGFNQLAILVPAEEP